MEFINADHVTFEIIDIVPELGAAFAGAFVVVPVDLAEPG